MVSRSIPKRSEVALENTWNLQDLFETNEAWLAEYESLKAVPARCAAFQGRLGESGETLLEFFRLQDELGLRLNALYGYANCAADVDTADSVYQDLRSKAGSVLVAISSAAAFSTPEIMAIPEETLEGFFKAVPALETYRRDLYLVRRMKEHILSPEGEMLLASAGEMADAPDNIGGMLRNADMRFPNVTDVEGNVHKLTNGSLVPLLESPDREFRKQVFETYYNRLGEYRNTIAATLDGQFKQLRFFAAARKYPNTLEAALFKNEVPVSVYHNLIEAVHQNFEPMYRYVALRRKLL